MHCPSDIRLLAPPPMTSLSVRAHPASWLVLLFICSLPMTAHSQDSPSQPSRAEASGAEASGAASSAPDASSRAIVPEGFDLQGHRGARGLAPENTLPAFRRALEVGVTTLELDVVISGDGKVVVSHEPWMSATICRTPDGAPIPEGEQKEHNLYAMTAAEAARYDCGTREHPRFPEQALQKASKPLLADVIEMAEAEAGRTDREPVFYNVETKIRPSWEGTFTPEPEPFAEAVLQVLEETGVARRSTIQSFDPRTLEVVHRRDAPVRTALLVAESLDRGLSQNLSALSFTPDVYSPAYRLVDAALLERASANGLAVIPWTVNDKDDMQQLIDQGVDGLITDYPNRAVEVLDRK